MYTTIWIVPGGSCAGSPYGRFLKFDVRSKFAEQRGASLQSKASFNSIATTEFSKIILLHKLYNKKLLVLIIHLTIVMNRPARQASRHLTVLYYGEKKYPHSEMWLEVFKFVLFCVNLSLYHLGCFKNCVIFIKFRS